MVHQTYTKLTPNLHQTYTKLTPNGHPLTREKFGWLFFESPPGQGKPRFELMQPNFPGSGCNRAEGVGGEGSGSLTGQPDFPGSGWSRGVAAACGLRCPMVSRPLRVAAATGRRVGGARHGARPILDAVWRAHWCCMCSEDAP